MEAVVGVKYRPAVFPNGAAAAAAPAKSKARAAGGGGLVAAAAAVYRECLKNHAASLGGHAVDGCGEFMPSPAADAADPGSLKCAACGCHRNFHRRLPDAPPSPPLLALPTPPPPPPPRQPAPAAAAAARVLLHGGHHHQRGGEETTPEVDHRMHRGPGRAAGEDSEDSDEMSDDYDDDRPASPLPAPPPPPPSVLLPPGGYLPSPTHMLLSLSTTTALPAMPPSGIATGSALRKRFRTKFSPEQKQRMQALSERLGWRLQKSDEAVVDDCCREIGVGKGVFKVWMHNNKHNFLAGHSARLSSSAAAAGGGGGASPLAPPPVLTADFTINGSAGSDHPATAANGGSPQSS